MEKCQLTVEQIASYGQFLYRNERSPGTIEKYLRDINTFVQWLGNRGVTKELTADWKACLLEQGYAPVTINSMLSALNGLFKFLGWNECQVKFLKIQRRLFRDTNRELTRSEYNRLLVTAKELGRDRLALLIETIGATGIRVSEVKYITVEAARKGKTEISLKGKIRVILLSRPSCAANCSSTPKNRKPPPARSFAPKAGKELSRRQIWAELKGLCKHADVAPTKVFPHNNLRHIFCHHLL